MVSEMSDTIPMTPDAMIGGTSGTSGTPSTLERAKRPARRGAPRIVEASGRWFDGRYNIPLPVHARLARGRLELRREAGDAEPMRQYAAGALDAGEAWRHSPTPVQLPDGGTLWVEAGSALSEALGAKSLPTRLIGSWRAVLACLVALIALIVWFDRQGAGLASGVVLPLVPKRIDLSIGNVIEQKVWKEWLAESRIDEERQERLEERFEEMVKQSFPDQAQTLTLKFGRTPKGDGGINAFALPNGTIVLLDGLTRMLSDDEVIAVLAHEAGHVRHRHGMRGLLQGAGLVAVSGVVLGDYSSAVATMVGTVQTLRYARNAERQSDAEAQRVLREQKLPPDTLVQVWKKLAASQPAAASEWPAWLSTHPDAQERIESAKRAEEEGGR